ncbi:MAG: CcmD family protein [Chloroflexota bacterium]|nr:CcmD family protein [Chloroflexota bacterium]
MENAGYLFAAYTIIWALVFGYTLSLYRKQKKLQRDVDLLKENLEEK